MDLVQDFQCNEVFYIGDTHGNFKLLEDKITHLNKTNCIFIHLGDFGIGFEDEMVEYFKIYRLSKLLEKYSHRMFVIRGNHDNPEYFGDKKFKRHNISLLDDYTVLSINGEKYLFVGGAISLSRGERLLKMKENPELMLYWENEGSEFMPEKLENLEGIQHVITHTAPNFIKPINDENNIYLSHGDIVERLIKKYNDSNLKEDLNRDRQNLTDIFDILIKKNNIRSWINGHFHIENIEEHNNVKFVTVAENEIYKLN